jgi:outer membrane lipoprotein-sorting protein
MVRTVTVDNDTRTTRATVAFDKGETLTIAYRTGPQAGTVTVIENPAERVFRTEQRRADAGARVAAVAADLTRRNEVVFEGTQRLDGTVTAVFSIEPPANAAESRPERRVWSDVTRAIPLRITSTWTASGQTVSETIRFTDVSLGEPNAQLSDESPSNPGRQRTGTRGAVA